MGGGRAASPPLPLPASSALSLWALYDAWRHRLVSFLPTVLSLNHPVESNADPTSQMWKLRPEKEAPYSRSRLQPGLEPGMPGCLPYQTCSTSEEAQKGLEASQGLGQGRGDGSAGAGWG